MKHVNEFRFNTFTGSRAMGRFLIVLFAAMGLWAALCVAVAPNAGQLAAAPATGEEGFVKLFNGKDLTGWEGFADLWSVKDGAIVGQTKSDPKLTHNTFLGYTKQEFGDFDLRLSFRINSKWANSGIQFRSKMVEKGKMGPIFAGYQGDMESGDSYTGMLYEERGRGIIGPRGHKTIIGADGKPTTEASDVAKSADVQASIKAGQWNEYRIVAKGNVIQLFINGLKSVELVDNQEAKAAKSGLIAFQLHVGQPMQVEFKDIRIKELK